MKNYSIDGLFSIFSNITKEVIIKLLFFILLTSLLETLGIALIVPVFKFIFSENLSEVKNIVQGIDIDIIRIIIIVIFVVFFVFKNILSYLILNKQLIYIFSLQENLSNKLFENYIYRDFSIHIKSDSAILTRNILNETNTLSNTLIQMLYFISEFLTLFFILTLLLIYQPLYTLIIIVFLSICIVVFYNFFSNKTQLLGEERQKYDAIKIKNIQIGLNALKEIKIFSSEEFFVNKFFESNRKSLINAKLQSLFQQIPKLYLEVVIIVTFSILSILFIIQRKSITEVVLILSFFGAAVFRLLPSLNRLMVAFQSIQLGYPSFRLLSGELVNFSKSDVLKDFKYLTPELFNFGIEIKNLNFSYDGNEKMILKNLNFNIKKGSFIAIVGESGQGKSTFVNILAGLIKPQNILMKIDGIITEPYNNKEWKKLIGYVPQKINIIDGTIADNIAFGVKSELIDYDRINEVIDMSGLRQFVNDLKLGSAHSIGDYGGLASGGQLQRLSIARALYHQPEILILDEATSSLDANIESEILDNLRSMKHKISIIMITHKKENLAFCDSVFLLNNFKLTQL